MGKVLSALIFIAIVIWGIVHLVGSEGNVVEAAKNYTGITAGTCVKDDDLLNVISCSSSAAAYRAVDQAQDSEGSDCPYETAMLMTESGTSETSYWCMVRL